MKRSFPLALVLLAGASITGLAQQTNAAQGVFERWKQQTPAEEVSKLSFALAVVTRRTDAGIAELNLWALGKATEVVVEVQPLYIETLPDGHYRQEKSGTSNITRIGSKDGANTTGDQTALNIIIPVAPNANAIEIKWMGYDSGKVQNAITTLSWLKNEPTEVFTKVTSN